MALALVPAMAAAFMLLGFQKLLNSLNDFWNSETVSEFLFFGGATLWWTLTEVLLFVGALAYTVYFFSC